MDPGAFLADLEAKPATLHALADAIDAGAMRWPVDIATAGRPRVLLTGMGSSWFAAQVAALRLRRHGIAAVAELSSADESFPPADDLLVVGVSASGGSAETLDFLHRYGSRSVALTNTAGSPITAVAGATVEMLAGEEAGGVACRSYQHTLIALLALEELLTGTDLGLPGVVRRCADATSTLLDAREIWLPDVLAALDVPHGVWALAPADRIGSALQAALMLREGPRRPADGCETGDWSHVDVYLTTTLDYRALVFTGSRHDPAAAQWMRERRSTAVRIGAAAERFDVRGPIVRYPDDDGLVALLTEVLVAELVAATWW